MQKGFSLVELSIVLVILGLLTGGILAGQNLIRAAELRSLSTQIQQISTAVYTFRDKYFALPGDMRNATDFWGIAAGTAGNDNACFDALGSGTNTCDGDGNGLFQTYAGNRRPEHHHFWKHLANAGLIEGSYTGRPGPNNYRQVVAGVNAPRAKMDQVTFSAFTTTSSSSDTAGTFAPNGGVLFWTGRETSTDISSTPFLKGEEAWNVDTKVDDGRPGYGKVHSFPAGSSYNPLCSTTASRDTAEYDVAASGTICSFRIYPGM